MRRIIANALAGVTRSINRAQGEKFVDVIHPNIRSMPAYPMTWDEIDRHIRGVYDKQIATHDGDNSKAGQVVVAALESARDDDIAIARAAFDAGDGKTLGRYVMMHKNPWDK